MNKKILLIDADSKIPNIALCKLSAYYKENNYKVDFMKLNIPYYPNRKKKIYKINTKGYDKIFCSIIFRGNRNYIRGENIIFGGSGYNLYKNLPEEIENFYLDYSIYPENNISYGFITRGCVRNCSFCIVPIKEGRIRQVNTIDNIVKHKKVKFLDNNILAYKNHCDILQELKNKKIKCQFNQGLDIRLINSKNSELLKDLNYMGEYLFALDDISLINLVENKVQKFLNWTKPWQLKFFVYINPKMEIKNFIKRIEFLKKMKILPYIMRDISCWSSKYSELYIDLCAWGNQPNLIKNMSFLEFLKKRHKNKDRIIKNMKLYYNNI